jgi:hypothetical protein
MSEHLLSPTTRTVELAQLEQLNEALAAPGAPRVTSADLGLAQNPAGPAPGLVLVGVSYEGPPDYPYIHGDFDGRRVDLHTPALRELSRRLHLHHTWGA